MTGDKNWFSSGERKIKLRPPKQWAPGSWYLLGVLFSQPGGVRVEYQPPKGAASVVPLLRGGCNASRPLVYGSR